MTNYMEKTMTLEEFFMEDLNIEYPHHLNQNYNLILTFFQNISIFVPCYAKTWTKIDFDPNFCIATNKNANILKKN